MFIRPAPEISAATVSPIPLHNSVPTTAMTAVYVAAFSVRGLRNAKR